MVDNRGVGSLSTESHEFMASGLDLFTKPEHDSSILAGKTIEHHMITALNDNNNVFEFVIPSEGHEYTYLPMTRLEGEVQIMKNNNTPVLATDWVAPVNLLSSALFRQVECELNGVQVADLTSPCYHYKSFIETHLTYGYEAKHTHLGAALWLEDTLNKEEAYDNTNNAYVIRKNWVFNNNGLLYFSTPLHIDFFNSQRYLIPGSTLKLKFLRNDDKFCLLSATDTWKMKINSLKLYTRKITVSQSIIEQHQTLLKASPCIYPLAQSKIKTFVINQGISATTIANIIRGKLPRSIIICMVKSDAFNGSYATNPWFFQPFGVKYFGLKVNGMPIPSSALQPDFAKGNSMREYRHFLDNIGVQHDNESNMITHEKFARNSCFFAYDLTPDLCHSFHSHTPNSGYIDLDLQFGQPLAQNITLIAYASFNEYLTIDYNGVVKLEP